MSFRARITAWVVCSSVLLFAVMMSTAYMQLEEELRQGRTDAHHPKIPGWEIHNSYSEAEIEDILGEVMETWLWTAIPMIALSLGAGLLLARRSLRPVHHINHQLASMRADSLRGDITIPETDPAIADLADHLNNLLERAGIAYQELAEFSARVAHELRTPLMLLRLRLEHAPPGIPADFQEELQDELARLSRFIERSLMAAKADQGALVATIGPMNLSNLVRDVAEDYQLLADEKNLSMSLEIPPEIPIHGDPDFLRQALHGLMENAVSYAHSGISVRCHGENTGAVLEIHNDMEPATMATSGLGLGLRLVRGICKVSGLRFEVIERQREFTALIRFHPETHSQAFPTRAAGLSLPNIPSETSNVPTS